MLTQTRETVLGALFTRLSSISFTASVRGKSSFTFVSRRLKMWTAVHPIKSQSESLS